MVVGQVPSDRSRDHLAARVVGILERARSLGPFAKRSGRAWLGRADDLDPIRDRDDFRALRLDIEFPADPFAR